MAHVRKDTYCETREWARHLRPYGKRLQAGMERQAAKKLIRQETAEALEEQEELFLDEWDFADAWDYDGYDCE